MVGDGPRLEAALLERIDDQQYSDLTPDDLEELRMDETIRGLGRALLVLHSTADRTVSLENAIHIFETANQPKSFVTLGAADHLLLDPVDARYAGEVIAAWAGRYLDMVKSAGNDRA